MARLTLFQLINPQKAILLNQIEERLANSAVGLNKIFSQLYEIRRERMKRLINTTAEYLQSLHSTMSTRDYLSTIWAMGQGGAGLLNSSFYQRYLGRRDTLRFALVQHILDIPKQYPAVVESVAAPTAANSPSATDTANSQTESSLTPRNVK